MTRPKYRVHVWKYDWKFGERHWHVGVWEDGGPVVFRPNTPVNFSTHAEALAAGLDWANELNNREQEDE